MCVTSAKIQHLILFSDRYRLFFFLISIVMCFVVSKSLTLTCCAPFVLMAARYFYSSKVIHNYLACALRTDMADIEEYYMKPTGKRGSGRLDTEQKLYIICGNVWSVGLWQHITFIHRHCYFGELWDLKKKWWDTKHSPMKIWNHTLTPSPPTHTKYRVSLSVIGSPCLH